MRRNSQGLGNALEQMDQQGWKTVDFTSRFLNPVGTRYSVNEHELLGALWAKEHFKYYLCDQ